MKKAQLQNRLATQNHVPNLTRLACQTCAQHTKIVTSNTKRIVHTVRVCSWSDLRENEHENEMK